MKRACLLGALCCAFTHGAWAQPRVVVRPFTGSSPQNVRTAVMQAIAEADGMDMVSNSEAESAAKSSNADLDTDAGKVAVARKLSVSAFVEGDVKQRGDATQVNLRVYDGQDGGLLTDVGIRARPALLDHEVRERFMTELGTALQRARPPPAERVQPADLPVPGAPEPAPAPQATPAKEPTPEPVVQARPAPVAPVIAEAEPEAEAPEKRLPRALELGAGLLVLTRNYAYNEALIKMSEHTVAPTPALRIEARWYPAAHFTDGFVANLGIDLYGQLAWPLDAQKGNTSFKTSSTALGIAARLRIPLSDSSDKTHELGLILGYGGQSFTIDNAKGQDPGIPSVAYGFARLGADARLMLHKALSLQGRLAYLALGSFGELEQRSWFSHVSGGGFEGQLLLGFDLSELVALTAGGGITRYFMALNPQPSDPSVSKGRIAGGLSDQYVYGLLGVTLRP